jgi:hypothetical protein
MIEEIAAVDAAPDPETAAMAGDAALLHDDPGEYEERDGHDRERIEAGVHALRDDADRDIGKVNGQSGGHAERKHDRRADND